MSAIATGKHDLEAILTPVGRLALLLIEGDQRRELGDLPGARTALEAAWRAGESLGWREYEYLLSRGLIANAAHDWVAQFQDNRRAAQLAKDAGDQFSAQHARLNSAIALLQLGRADEARGLLEQAVEDGGPPVILASLLVSLSLAHQQLAEYPRALACLQRAVEIAEQAEPPLPPRPLASTLGKAGCLLHTIGYPDRAIPILRRAEKVAESAGDTSTMLSARFCLADILRQKGDLPAALPAYQQIARSATDAGQLLTAALALRNLARVQSEMGDVPAAIDQAREAARTLIRSGGSLKEQGSYHLDLAQMLRKTKRFEEAASALQTCTSIASERGMEALDLAVCRERANLFAAQGRTDLALAVLRSGRTRLSHAVTWRSLDLLMLDEADLLEDSGAALAAHAIVKELEPRWKASGRPVDEYLICDRLMRLESLFGRDEDARRHGLEGMRLAEARGDLMTAGLFAAHVATLDSNHAIDSHESDVEAALSRIEDLLGVSSGMSIGCRGQLWTVHASLLVASGRAEEAAMELQNFLTDLADCGDHSTLLYARSGLGRALGMSGKTSEAVDLLRHVLSEARDLELPLIERDALEKLTDVLFAGKRYSEVVETAHTILGTNSGLARGPVALLLPRTLSDSRKAADMMIAALLRLEKTGTSDIASQAFEAIEVSRGQILAQQIRQQGAGLRSALPWKPLDAEAKARQEVEAAQTELQRLATKGDSQPTKIGELKQRLDAAYRDLEQALLALHQQSAAIAGWTHAVPLTAEQACRMLDETEALVLYHRVAKVTVAVVVRNSATYLVNLGNSAAIDTALEPWRSILPITGTEDATAAARAYDALFRPLEPHLHGTTSVLLCPDGPLASVPFEALLRRGSDGKPEERLIERFEVRYGASGRVLSLLRQRPAGEPRDGFVAIGDPDYSDEAVASLEPVPEEFVLRDGGDRRPLPESGAEVRSLAALFGDGAGKVLLGREASRSGVEMALAERSKSFAVHFACHGHIDEAHPLLTGLVLAGGQVLNATDLMRMRAAAHVVVLSACESARGAELPGEGVVGLVRAFEAAGASHVVVAHWPVPDKGTREFMTDFYRAMLAGKSPAAALRAVKLDRLRQGGTAAHPANWANFVVW